MSAIIKSTPFVPHAYADIVARGVFSEGSVPEKAYAQLIERYKAVEDVEVARIAYLSAGLKITGLSALPRDIHPQSHPLLIYNRGGSGDYGMLTVLNVMREMVPFARAGYLMFASNYRGNDGGEGQDEFGGGDVDDVLALAELARAHPGWDGRNLYLLGHSRGGMMTCLTLKRGLSVNAAAIIAGVFDLCGDLRASPRMEDLYRRRIPGYAQAPEATLEARSALCWPEAITAPLLLLHGTGDKIVDATQSERLAATLNAMGKPCELMLYPGDGHALVKNREDVQARLLAWFERWKA